MYASNKCEHQDVIRVVVSSDKSFDDAVAQGIREVQKVHHDFKFQTYEVVNMQGTIKYDGEEPGCEFFQVVLDLAGVHSHDH